MKKFKAAVIGCGWIGAREDLYGQSLYPSTHAGMYAVSPKISLEALVDTNNQNLTQAQKIFPKAQAFFSIPAMLPKIQPDIISIATPTKSHAQHVLEITQSKFKPKIILCEKPIAKTEKEAKDMIKVCRKNKIKLLINYQRSFDPLLLKWAQKVKKGELGKILQGTLYYYNGLTNNGSHWINLLRIFLGPVKQVIGISNKMTSENSAKENIDGFLIFQNGARVALQSLSKNYGHSELTLIGEKGALAIKKLGFTVEYQKKVANQSFQGFYELASPVKSGQKRSLMLGVLESLTNCLEKKEEPLSTGEAALSDLKIINQLKKSSQTNSLISLN